MNTDRLARYVASASVPLATTGLATTGVMTLAAPSVGDIVVSDTPVSVQNYFDFLSTANGAIAGIIQASTGLFGPALQFGFGPGMDGGGLGVVSATDGGFSEWARLGVGDMIGGDNMGAADYGSLYFAVFNNGGTITYGPYGNFTGDGGELSSGYIGFTFDTNLGDTVYAWAEVNLQSNGRFTVERWAYDDAGGSIAAGAIPAPGALGLLALAGGAAGIRRKRQA